MQNSQNHRRYNIVHHFIVLPLSSFAFLWSLARLFEKDFVLRDDLFYALIALTLLVLTLLARRYALRNQDRIIRVEMCLRYFELAGKSFSEKEKQLRLGQIIALRFAGDEELLPLMERTISENLSNKEIKAAIKNWQADKRRV